ncbi:hypothetical protein MKX08_006644 [Trichoderma sp. CBMAI-0020]|nr:hypothetical protein MKX08_006644 [Trichoderma sp. CBMAI-0020]
MALPVNLGSSLAKKRGKGRFVTTPYKLFASAQTPSRLGLRVPLLIMQPTCIHHIAFITIARDGTAAAEYPPDHQNATLSLGPRHGTNALQSFDSYTVLPYNQSPVLDVSHPNGSAAALNFIIVLGFLSHHLQTPTRLPG